VSKIRDHNSATNIKTIVQGILNGGCRPVDFRRDDKAAEEAASELDGNNSDDTASSSSDSDSDAEDVATHVEGVDEATEDDKGEELCHAAVEGCGSHISALLWALQTHPWTAAAVRRQAPRRGKRLPSKAQGHGNRRPADKVPSSSRSVVLDTHVLTASHCMQARPHQNGKPWHK